MARTLPSSPGVYFMKDEAGSVMYVGKAVSLRDRVGSYFASGAQHAPRIQAMVERVARIDILECESEVEALLSEARLIKDLQPPYNELLKDGKSFPYIEITTDEPFPRVRVTRDPHRKGSDYIGPFVAGGSLKPALDLLQKIFRFRTCELDIRPSDPANRSFSPCLLHHIGRCTAPCADRIDPQSYADDLAGLRRVLMGRTREVKIELEVEMARASRSLEYEKAALARDRLRALEGLKTAGPLGQQPEQEIAPLNSKEGMEQLATILKMDFVPRTLEAYDIAHLQGRETVASVVTFIDGKPFREGYRHMRIQTAAGSDDYGAMREALSRRFRRLKDEQQPYPHLLLLDGGAGQLTVGVEVVGEYTSATKLMALAKKEEKIHIPGRSRAIVLSRHETALRVLQHARDEAHRFARRYHHLLRDRDLMEGS